MNKKIIIAITGASGSIYGLRALEILKEIGIETHLIISKSAQITINSELDISIDQIKELADYNYNSTNIGASIASGSFKTDGMIIAPCSIKTMSEIANGITSNLVSRSADVILKERRKLILMVREMPFHLGHLENMTKLARIGAIIAPPVPAFYTNPQNIDDIINHNIGRILDLMDIDNEIVKRWKGLK